MALRVRRLLNIRCLYRYSFYTIPWLWERGYRNGFLGFLNQEDWRFRIFRNNWLIMTETRVKYKKESSSVYKKITKCSTCIDFYYRKSIKFNYTMISCVHTCTQYLLCVLIVWSDLSGELCPGNIIWPHKGNMHGLMRATDCQEIISYDYTRKLHRFVL